MIGNKIVYLKRLAVFYFFSVLLIVFSCRIQIAPIAILIGLLIGWKSIENTYMLRKGKMNLVSDFQYFLTLGALILSAVQIVPFSCNFISAFQGCSQQVKITCAFLFSFSTGIASFSLWLWFRLRGNFILVEHNTK